jgi:hypothetical protein
MYLKNVLQLQHNSDFKNKGSQFYKYENLDNILPGREKEFILDRFIVITIESPKSWLQDYYSKNVSMPNLGNHAADFMLLLFESIDYPNLRNFMYCMEITSTSRTSQPLSEIVNDLKIKENDIILTECQVFYDLDERRRKLKMSTHQITLVLNCPNYFIHRCLLHC